MSSYYDNAEFSDDMKEIQHYCKRAAKFSILTKEEELELIRQTRSDDPAVQEAYKIITKFKFGSQEAEEAYEIIRVRRCTDPKVKRAYDDLVDRNLRLVIKKAKEFVGKGIPLNDLVQEGITGLVRAIEKFDPERGNKLSTYATRWIEQRVRRALENKSRLVKIPLNRLAQVTALKKAYKKYVEDENRPPSSEEIAEILGITEAEAQELGRFMYPSVSLDAEGGGEDENLSMINYLVDEKMLPEEKTEDWGDKSYVHSLLTLLSKDDSDFIKLSFGFLDNEPRNDREMASILKITTKEVKEKKKKILERLKETASYEDVNFEV